MARKLYVKMFGCQTNEYDSARPTDLLAASHGPECAVRAEDEVDLPRRIAVRSYILPG